MEYYNFIINEKDFNLDYANIQEVDYDNINNNKFKIIYELAYVDENGIEYESTKFLQTISKFVINKILNIPGLEIIRDNIKLEISIEEIEKIIKYKPLCIGNEFINEIWINNIINEILNIYRDEINKFDGSVDLYFSQKNKKIIIPSRIYFHMVESNNEKPFAFIATYTSKVNNLIKHFPLKYALKEYKDSPSELNNLTKVIFKISKKSPFIERLLETGDIFLPIYLTVDEAYQFLKEVELYENNGIICRIPNWWNQKNENTNIRIDIEQKKKDSFGFFKESNLVNIVPEMYYNRNTYI